jgi:sigma-E factor negative regulatory protein RseC
MEKEEGLVIETTEKIARIKAGKHNECKSCGACPGNDTAIITAENKIGAAPGQRVLFEIQETNSIKGAFIIFVLPLIGIFTGALLGGYLGGSLGYPVAGCRIFGGAVVFLIAAAIIKIIDSHVARKEKSLPIITRIL